MKTTGRLMGGLVCALAVGGIGAGAAYGQVSGAWSDDFDSYTAGLSISQQSHWEPWDNNPAADGLVSDAESHSAPNSVSIEGTSDIITAMDSVSGGKWTMSIWVFIPGDMVGDPWFVYLNQYVHGGPYNWSGQFSFDISSGEVTWRGAAPAGVLPLVTDDWVEIIVEIDFDADIQDVFYDGSLLGTWSWINGQGGAGLPQLEAMDLWANDATIIYWDDAEVKEAGGGGGMAGQLDCPIGGGRATLTLAGGTPDGKVGVVASTNGNGFTIPVGPCTGTVIATRPAFLPGFPITLKFDANGDLAVSKNVPAGLCGVISVSAVDLTTCDVVDLP